MAGRRAAAPPAGPSSSSPTARRRSRSRWPASAPGDTVVVAGKGHETGQEVGRRGAPLRRPPGARAPRCGRGSPAVIALTLAEVAAAVGGTVVATGRLPARRGGRSGRRRLPAGRPGLAVRRGRGRAHRRPRPRPGGAGRREPSAALVARPVRGRWPACVVADVVVALGLLAREVLRRLPDVSWSSASPAPRGKTSTKDLLAQVLATHGPTVAPQGSFNNDIGLPLTVLRVDADTRYLVLEYSARGVGHIARLCEVAPPRIAAVLNVGSAHAGEFGGREVDRAGQGRAGRGAARRDGPRRAQRRRPAGDGDGRAHRRPGRHRRAAPPTADVHPADVAPGRAGPRLVHARLPASERGPGRACGCTASTTWATPCPRPRVALEVGTPG